jgi:hypothetical protein
MKENIVSVDESYPEAPTSFKEDFHWLVDRGFIALSPGMSEWRNNTFIDLRSEPVVTKVVMVPGKDPARDSLPKDKETYDHCLLFGKHVLFIDGRFKRDNLPKGLYAYDLRGSDDDPGEPATLERNVLVNHAGTVISAEPLLEEDTDYRELGEGLDFQDDAMTLRDFIEMYSLEWERSLWKWRASRTIFSAEGPITSQGQLSASPAEAIESMLKAVDDKTRKEVIEK